jgi:hypothetical protein
MDLDRVFSVAQNGNKALLPSFYRLLGPRSGAHLDPSSHRAGTLAPIAPMLPQVLFKLSVYWMHSEVREGA